MAWSLKTTFIIITLSIATVTRGENKVRKEENLCAIRVLPPFVTFNRSLLHQKYLVAHKCKNKKISPWCVDFNLGISQEHPCKLIVDSNPTLVTNITNVKDKEVKLEVGSSLPLGIHTIHAKNVNLKLILLDPDGYRIHAKYDNVTNFKTTKYLDGHQIQKPYHPNSTTKTKEDNNIKVTSKFDKLVASETFIACLNVVKELLQNERPYDYGNNSIPYHHRSLIKKNGKDGSKFYLHCGIIDPDEDPGFYNKSHFEYHCYYNHLNGTNQMKLTFEVSYQKQWGEKNLARLNQTGYVSCNYPSFRYFKVVNGSLQDNRNGKERVRERDEIYFNELRFQLDLNLQKADPALAAAAASVGIILTLAVAGIVLIKNCRNKSKHRTPIPLFESVEMEIEDRAPWLPKVMKFKMEHITIDKTRPLGKGSQATVWNGHFRPMNPINHQVAIKESDNLHKLLDEAKIMCKIGGLLNPDGSDSHDNVLKMFGVVFDGNLVENYLVLELCSNGDLKSYMDRRYDFLFSEIIEQLCQIAKSSPQNNAMYQPENIRRLLAKKLNDHGEEELDVTDLHQQRMVDDLLRKGSKQNPNARIAKLTGLNLIMSWCYQVALGMQFVTEKRRIIHGDLSARNILVTEALTVKISDFGRSQDLYMETEAKLKTYTKLPLKWMAYEVLDMKDGSIKADIWSFGVLVWEIFTLGRQIPYGGADMNAYQLRELLKSGKRLPKPRPCPPFIYNLMLCCWNGSPAMRPTFEELISSFELLPYLVMGSGDEQYARKLVTASVENLKYFHRTKTGMEDEYMTPSNTMDRSVSWTRRPKPPSQGENHPAMRRPQNLFFINPRRSIGHQRLSNMSSYLDLASQFSPTSTIGSTATRQTYLSMTSSSESPMSPTSPEGYLV